jgi:hypothetical protein
MKPSKAETERSYDLANNLRIASERREARSHQVAAALDEVLTLCLIALNQAANTGRGMQQRRAARLLSRFTAFREDALEGRSPCQGRKEIDVDITDMDGRNTLVR